MRLAMLAFAGAIAAAAPPAAAQTPADRADVRCLLVLQAVSRDPEQREKAAQGIFYYLGKFQVRGGVTRLEPMILAEAKALTPQQAQTELARCGAELHKQTQDLQAANKRVQAAASPPPAKK